jgi:quercetin dioxygenase-like cupin family protein
MQQIEDILPRELAPGILGRYVHGNSMTLGYVRIEAASILPVHKHEHEQITCMIEGKMEMMIGENKQLLTKGSVYVIPSNTPHSAYALTDCIVIDVFNPVRQDYK